ncbi:polymorphic toxin-type HINT domain-containing protein [Streptomyces violascens]|uniref:polymorphic toxin-type HINT domain-containing protein n=1 Tax=Streptomyces violascens TaxID=67381 RepID=UPI003664FEC8
MYNRFKTRALTLVMALWVLFALGSGAGTATAAQPEPAPRSILDIAKDLRQAAHCDDQPLLARAACLKDFAQKAVRVGVGLGLVDYVLNGVGKDTVANIDAMKKQIAALDSLRLKQTQNPTTILDPKQRQQAWEQIAKTYSSTRPVTDDLLARTQAVILLTKPTAEFVKLEVEMLHDFLNAPERVYTPDDFKGGGIDIEGFLKGVGEGIDQMNAGFDEMNAGLAQMNDALAEINEGLAQANRGIDQANRGMDQINAGISQANGSVDEINQHVGEMRKAIDKLHELPTIDFSGVGVIDPAATWGSGPSALDSDEQQRRMSLLFDLLPGTGTAKGLVEALVGKDVFTGEELSSTDRVLGALPILQAIKDGRKLPKAEEISEARRLKCAVPNSFTAQTPVLMADGTTKPIKDIRRGDAVLATDPDSHLTAARRVEQVITGSGTKHLTQITLTTGASTATVTATAAHPFWNETRHAWVDAESLTVGDRLHSPDGTTPTVTAIRSWTQAQDVFNLSVNQLHTYYVLAGHAPVLVHNVNCSGLIPLGGSDLAQMAKEYRMKKSVSPGENVAVFEYETGSGPGYLTTKNTAGGQHSEESIDDYIKKAGIDPASVTRIYSERVPCSQSPHYCAVVVGKYPKAQISFSLSGTSRQNFMDLLLFMRGS